MRRRGRRHHTPTAVLLLLERGADWKQGKSLNGLPFASVIDGEVGSQGNDSAFVDVRRYLQQCSSTEWNAPGRAHHVIYFATPERWREYPEWAKARRDEIIARVVSEFREPDYEYHSAAAGGTVARAAPVVSTPSGKRALFIAVLMLFAVAGGMGWLVTRGVVGGETYYPNTRPSLRRMVSRPREPVMFWASIGVYAIIGAGTLTLGVLGVRAGRRLGK